ncbi:26529_t:CDS:1, partial [Gigaspora margarita]
LTSFLFTYLRMPSLHKFQSQMAKERRAANASRIRMFRRKNLQQKDSNTTTKLAQFSRNSRI